MNTYTRRTLLSASIAAAGAGLLSGCSGSGSSEPGPRTGSARRSEPGRNAGPAEGGRGFVPKGPKGYVNPSDPEVLAAERERGSGPVRTFRFTAAETSVDLGGKTVRTWAYGNDVPGKEVRVTAGDILDLTLVNRLPVGTTLHTHGARLRCDMDGVPWLTQAPIEPGEDFRYRFVVSHPGTYLLHSHEGMQLDRGLFAPLIVEDPKEPLSYDKEWVVVLDDWLDGVDGSTPDGALLQLHKGKLPRMDMGGGSSGHTHRDTTVRGPSRILRHSHSTLLDGMGGNVAYPYYLINGRLPQAPSVFRARPGDRIRLRIINAGGDTPFRVALGGHQLTVTHTDGYPVKHRTTDALLLGMSERYDVLVTAKDGVFPLVALAEGKNARALAVLRTDNSKTLPPPSVHLDELDRRVVPARRMSPDDSVAYSDREPDRHIRIKMTGNMKQYNWAFDHRPYSIEQRHPIRQGERVRVTLINATDMWHPMHLHGHTFALTGFGDAGTRKDTAIVLPHRKLVLDFYADNPGLWMLHCHNQYHSESGMMTILGYLKK
ncbi:MULTISPECIES: multicopper oxidase family protein [Streptomyces]|uniref:multicopper oxidase family protein n=1 Tax=Streptomyces TaxID=1883 RepID=UPI00082E94B3|nr:MULTISPECIES: multicopper oxidase family protein [Streptomyces]MDN5383135.1 multicopper oxidase family protein [Streptomyces sp. LB8]